MHAARRLGFISFALIALCLGGCPSDATSESNGGGSGTSGGAAGTSGGTGSLPTADQCTAACNHQASCGAEAGECMAQCPSLPAACVSCLATQCFEQCAAQCEDGGGGGSGMGGTTGPQPECTSDQDCGISYECVSCVLTDTAGFCELSEPCNFDEDCGIGNKCGYNVVTSDYRCLPADRCP